VVRRGIGGFERDRLPREGWVAKEGWEDKKMIGWPTGH
jgi:hypothetical protein